MHLLSAISLLEMRVSIRFQGGIRLARAAGVLSGSSEKQQFTNQCRWFLIF